MTIKNAPIYRLSQLLPLNHTSMNLIKMFIPINMLTLILVLHYESHCLSDWCNCSFGSQFQYGQALKQFDIMRCISKCLAMCSLTNQIAPPPPRPNTWHITYTFINPLKTYIVHGINVHTFVGMMSLKRNFKGWQLIVRDRD